MLTHRMPCWNGSKPSLKQAGKEDTNLATLVFSNQVSLPDSQLLQTLGDPGAVGGKRANPTFLGIKNVVAFLQEFSGVNTCFVFNLSPVLH